MSSFIMIPAVGQTLPLCTHIAGETVYSATFAVAWNAFVLFWKVRRLPLRLYTAVISMRRSSMLGSRHPDAALKLV
jgi:hypothetical protein